MGWIANAIVVAGTFIGYKYTHNGQGALKPTDCAKIQCNAVQVSASQNGFPKLSDDQKMVVIDTIRELTLTAGKAFESGSQKTQAIAVVLRNGKGIEQSFLILSRDVPSLTSRLTSVGLGVTSIAGGILVQGGMNLLDPDVLQGVATMQANYKRRQTRKDESIGLMDNFSSRRYLDELEREENEMFRPKK